MNDRLPIAREAARKLGVPNAESKPLSRANRNPRRCTTGTGSLLDRGTAPGRGPSTPERRRARGLRPRLETRDLMDARVRDRSRTRSSPRLSPSSSEPAATYGRAVRGSCVRSRTSSGTSRWTFPTTSPPRPGPRRRASSSRSASDLDATAFDNSEAGNRCRTVCAPSSRRCAPDGIHAEILVMAELRAAVAAAGEAVRDRNDQRRGFDRDGGTSAVGAVRRVTTAKGPTGRAHRHLPADPRMIGFPVGPASTPDR